MDLCNSAISGPCVRPDDQRRDAPWSKDSRIRTFAPTDFIIHMEEHRKAMASAARVLTFWKDMSGKVPKAHGFCMVLWWHDHAYQLMTMDVVLVGDLRWKPLEAKPLGAWPRTLL